jgi:hypothetical protein
MVKTPKTRHSKPSREPVTIELEPGAVSRVASEPEAADQAGAADEAPNREAAAEQATHASQPADDAPTQDALRAPEADFEPWEHDEAAKAAAEHDSGESSGVDDRSAERPEPETASHRAYGYGFDEAPLMPERSGSNGNAPTSGDPKPRASEPPPKPATEKRGGLGLIAAGLIGGVVTLVGAGALQYAGLLGSPGAAITASNGVDDQIAELRSEITTLKNAGDGGLGMKIDGLSTALDQVKADVAALQAASASGGDNTALSALSDKVAEIEKTVAAHGQDGNAAPVDIGPLNEKLAALDALVKSAGDASTAQEGRLTALEQSVSQLSAKVDAQASQPKIALAIAASALKAALDRGAPFAAELDTFAAITPDAPQIAALRAYAEKGVPTRTEIAGGMDAAANAMVAADEPANADAGFFRNLLSSAESLVKVRPIGAVEGKGVPETVARMEVAVNQGDYAKALAEYDTLPEPAKAAGADFAGKLKARLDVEAQVDALISGAMKA